MPFIENTSQNKFVTLQSEYHRSKYRLNKKAMSAHKVDRLFAFGSVLKESSFNKESDIDLIVDFVHIDLYAYADNYFDMKQQLEEIFKRPVDLLEEKAIRNPYLRLAIDKEKKLIYG